MTLQQYWTILVKQWRLVVLCFLVVGVGAYVGSRLMTPLYQSATLVQVVIHADNNQSINDSLQASDQLVQTEAQLATSDPVLREVASHYPGLTVDQLLKEVISTSKTNTQLFEIDVLDPSPTRAAALANDIAATLIKQQDRAAQQDSLQSQQQIKQDLQQTQQQINATIAQIATLQAKNAGPIQINSLKVQLNGLQQHYTQVQIALAQLELTEAQNSSFLRIAQSAQPALIPVRPNKLLNTGAGLLTGLLLGMLLAMLFELLDVRVRTPEALTQLLGWPILATIWRAAFREDVINPSERNSNVESYRILRTNIGFAEIDKPLHTLLVTSSVPRDGKSIVAANLAIFMARAGKNTLLIDADLRRPTQHDKFGLPSHAMGFSNAILAFGTLATANVPAYQQASTSTTSIAPSSTPAIARSPSLDPFVHKMNVPNLCVMPSGPLPPNPPELLDSKAMQGLFAALSTCRFEVVIFDTPPLLGLSDASILASKVDGTLIVVDITRAKKGDLKQVKSVLERAGAHALGCIVNKQRRRRKEASYSYYYGTNEKKDRQGKKAARIAPVPADRVDQPVTQPQLELPDMNTVKTASANSMQLETQFQPGLLDGRKGEQNDSRR